MDFDHSFTFQPYVQRHTPFVAQDAKTVGQLSQWVPDVYSDFTVASQAPVLQISPAVVMVRCESYLFPTKCKCLCERINPTHCCVFTCTHTCSQGGKCMTASGHNLQRHGNKPLCCHGSKSRGLECSSLQFPVPFCHEWYRALCVVTGEGMVLLWGRQNGARRYAMSPPLCLGPKRCGPQGPFNLRN